MSRPDKVVLLASNFSPVRGGSAIVYHNLARAAPQHVVVIAPRLNYLDGLPLIGWREHDRRASYAIIRLPLLRTILRAKSGGSWEKLRFRLTDLAIRLRVLFAVAGVMLRQRARVLCVGELVASGWLVNLLRLVPGIRVIVYVHGEEITTADVFDPDCRRRARTLLAADGIVVVSRFTLDTVQALLRLPDPQRRLRLIQNGVELARFAPRGKSAALAAQYGLQGCFVFVSVCRLVEKKGLDMAIQAFASVVKSRPGCRLLIVGTGPDGEILKSLARDLALDDSVRFAGEVSEDELVDHYCLGDVFVMPNRRLANGDTEGFGLVFLEANGCGLPVIAGRDGGSTDAVRSGENGLVVDGTSPQEIAAAMMALHDDAALRETLRRGGLAAAAKADWHNKAAEFLDFCLMRGHPD